LVCDEKTLVAEDYGEAGNPEHSANALMPALDNWMYSSSSAVRHQFRDGRLVAEPTIHRGQWGMTQDDAGRLFYNYNASPLHVDLVPGEYLVEAAEGAGSAGELPPLVNVSIVDDFSVLPAHVTPMVTLGATDLRDDGTLKQFTASCAPYVYRGTLFPAEFRGNAFICEPVGNLVSRFTVRGDGPGLRGQPTHVEREFLVSTDERFRPSFLESGPDGALYIADMYTGIIEDRRFVTEYLRNQIISRGFNRFTETGRIYRIVPDGAPGVKEPSLADLSGAGLVKKLSHPNGWVRDTAQRLLVDRADGSVLPSLRKLVANGAVPLGRLHALWACDGLGGIDEDTVLVALGDQDPRVRSSALRLGERLVNSDSVRLAAAYRAMRSDMNTGVRLQLILSLGEVDADWARIEIAGMLADDDSALLGSAAANALRGKGLELFDLVLAHAGWSEASPSRTGLLQRLGGSLVGRKSAEELADVFGLLAAAPWQDWRVKAILDGMASAKAANLPIVLVSEPDLIAALRTSPLAELQVMAAALSKHFTWEGKQAVAAKTVDPLSAVEQRLFDVGRVQYSTICVSCHLPTGQGMAGT
jgi:hypothetical protein